MTVGLAGGEPVQDALDAEPNLELPIYRQRDLFAASGWAAGRWRLLNVVRQVAYVTAPLVASMTRPVQDIGVGLNDR